MLISRGNLKLGVMPSFSLPPEKTCPGSTPFCEEYCFGKKGRYVFPQVMRANDKRLEASMKPDFAFKIVKELRKVDIPVFRFHVTGDYYSEEYIMKWVDIAAHLPEITLFGSTRSWHVPDLAAPLAYLREMPNMILRASVDPSDEVMPGPEWSTWSIEGDGQLCPHDNDKKHNCFTCGRCWQDRRINSSFKLRWAEFEDYLATMRPV